MRNILSTHVLMAKTVVRAIFRVTLLLQLLIYLWIIASDFHLLLLVFVAGNGLLFAGTWQMWQRPWITALISFVHLLYGISGSLDVSYLNKDEPFNEVGHCGGGI